MTWIRLKKSFTNSKGKKFPVGHKFNKINPEEWVKSGQAEYCNRDDVKMDSEFFKPKKKK